MDRVQKSKLSLYKKTMDVSVRVFGLEGWRTHNVDLRSPGLGPWDRACLNPCPTTHTIACWVFGAELGAKDSCGWTQALPLGGS